MIPKVSIIIPIFNAAQWLERCLSSIMRQTYRSFEVIMVNDGSTDNSGLICDEFTRRDPRFKVFNVQNGGVSSARNIALRESIGDWIVFVDADDSLPHDSIEKRITVAQKHNVDLVVCNIVEVASDGREMNKNYPFAKECKFSGEEVISRLMPYALLPNNFFGGCCNKLYRRKIFEDNSIRFPQRERAEDWLVNIQYLEKVKSAIAIPYIAYYYFRNNSSAMSKPFPNQIDLWRESAAIKSNLINKYGFDIDKGTINANTINEVVEYVIKLTCAQQSNNVLLAKKAFAYCRQQVYRGPIDVKSLFFLAKVVKPLLMSGFNLIAFGVIKIWVLLKCRRC